MPDNIVSSGGSMRLARITVRSQNYESGTVGSSDDFKLTKKDGTIADSVTVTLRIKSVANYNGKINLQSATFKSGDMVVGTATGGQLAGDPIYTISNDLTSSADLTIENLLFYENHLPVDSDVLGPATPIDAAGMLETGAVLDGPETAEDCSVPPIADGTFFICHGQVFNEATLLLSGGSLTATPRPSRSRRHWP